ncbi:MerR family transcriptional regulator [Micromonospora sonneratiae]|uniref:MerR family transcriptional regulator n=1 Tax=Micromonospora sonneratiae TaxID=1184706 RepID=A0ABW3YCW9_9ACTN
MPEEFLAIGQFARLCRLSVKQLRHYDDVGLLPPAHVDPVTGYRYYGRDQVRDALAIALLRTLDVPLSAIAQTLRGDASAQTAALRAERDRLEARLARQRNTLAALERLLRDGLLQQEVGLTREPPRRLLVAQAVCAPDGIGVAIAGCMTQLSGVLPGLSWTPPMWGLFPVDVDRQMHIAVGVESAADPVGGTTVEYLPGGPAVVATHVGPYEHLALTYQAMFAWIHERGLHPNGPVREAYLTDPTTSDPTQLATRIVIPIEEEDEC